MTDQHHIRPSLRLYLRVVNLIAVTPILLVAVPIVAIVGGFPVAYEVLVDGYVVVWRLLESEREFSERRDREKAAEKGKVLDL